MCVHVCVWACVHVCVWACVHVRVWVFGLRPPRFHTLALVRENMSVCSFGLGTVGQLGTGTSTGSCRVPTRVFVNQPPAVTVGDSGSLGLEYVVKRIFAGGDQSFASGESAVCISLPVCAVCIYPPVYAVCISPPVCGMYMYHPLPVCGYAPPPPLLSRIFWVKGYQLVINCSIICNGTFYEC